MRILIADDEPLALVRLQALLAEIDDVEIVGTARDGEDAASQIAALKPDLALLDIRMPRQSGLALARALAETSSVEVIFVTAFDHFASQAFEVDAVDYLLKPVEPQRLAIAIDRARRRRKPGGSGAVEPATDGAVLSSSASNEGFWVPGRDGLVRVALSSIDWIEAARDYVLLHTTSRSHMLRSTMDAIQKQMDPDVMARVSRSAFVRRDAVSEVTRLGRTGYVIVLHDGTPVRVGATYARTVELIDPMAVATARP